MAIPRRCEYVYEETGNRCENLATPRGNPKWYCKHHLEELNSELKQKPTKWAFVA